MRRILSEKRGTRRGCLIVFCSIFLFSVLLSSMLGDHKRIGVVELKKCHIVSADGYCIPEEYVVGNCFLPLRIEQTGRNHPPQWSDGGPVRKDGLRHKSRLPEHTPLSTMYPEGRLWSPFVNAVGSSHILLHTDWLSPSVSDFI